MALYADQEDNLLVGTANGLSRLKDNHFDVFNATERLATSTILCLLADREGNLWIGTESGGLNLLKDTKFTTYTVQNGLSSDLVKIDLHRPARQYLGWHRWRRVESLKERPGSQITQPRDGLAGNSVLALHGDRDGNLWAGTPEGLSRFRDGRFTNLYGG